MEKRNINIEGKKEVKPVKKKRVKTVKKVNQKPFPKREWYGGRFNSMNDIE